MKSKAKPNNTVVSTKPIDVSSKLPEIDVANATEAQLLEFYNAHSGSVKPLKKFASIENARERVTQLIQTQKELAAGSKAKPINDAKAAEREKAKQEREAAAKERKDKADANKLQREKDKEEKKAAKEKAAKEAEEASAKAKEEAKEKLTVLEGELKSAQEAHDLLVKEEQAVKLKVVDSASKLKALQKDRDNAQRVVDGKSVSKAIGNAVNSVLGRGFFSGVTLHKAVDGEGKEIANPRREGTFGWHTWEALKSGMTMKELEGAGGRAKDIKWDYDRGAITVKPIAAPAEAAAE